MDNISPTLHVLCGKIAAGKSTFAAKLCRVNGTVLLAEDDWLSALFSGEMSSPSDYVRCSSKLRRIMGPHVVSLLNGGVSVVLDFAANTLEQRAWMCAIIEASGALDQLHVFNASDELCLARLRERNARGDHPFTVTEEQFLRFSEHFVAPSLDEGFNIVMHDE